MRKRKSRLLAELLASSRRLHEHGLMSDERWREFECGCSPLPDPMPPSQIRELIVQSNLHYFTFARLLNTPPRLVLRWQQGLARPRGPELKLLHLIRERGLDAVV